MLIFDVLGEIEVFWNLLSCSHRLDDGGSTYHRNVRAHIHRVQDCSSPKTEM